MDAANIQSLVPPILEYATAVAVIDAAIRRVISIEIQYPAQSYTEIMMTAGSTITRALVSGLLYAFLLTSGYLV